MLTPARRCDARGGPGRPSAATARTAFACGGYNLTASKRGQDKRGVCSSAAIYHECFKQRNNIFGNKYGNV